MPGNVTIFDQDVSLDVPYFNMVWVEKVLKKELLKLQQLKKLRHLNASCYRLQDKDLLTIGTLTQVELLDLVMTEITDSGLGHLQNMVCLEELRLKDNPQLTDNCIPHLVRLKSLKLLHLGTTSVTISGVRQLLEALELETLVLDDDFEDHLEDLKALASSNSKLEIIVKGVITLGI